MVVLAALALTTGLTVSGLRGPSPSLALKRDIGDMHRAVADARHHAIAQSQIAQVVVPNADCQNRSEPVRLIFFPDGTAAPAEMCLGSNGLAARFRVDALTGRIVRAGL